MKKNKKLSYFSQVKDYYKSGDKISLFMLPEKIINVGWKAIIANAPISAAPFNSSSLIIL